MLSYTRLIYSQKPSYLSAFVDIRAFAKKAKKVKNAKSTNGQSKNELNSGEGNIQYDVNDVKQMLTDSIASFERKIKTVQIGKTDPKILSTVKVIQNSTTYPLNKLAQVVVKNPQTLFVTPFDKSTTKQILEGIVKSGFGFNPIEDKGGLLVPIPKVTKEVRDQQMKLTYQYSEECKQRIRRVRTKGVNQIKAAEKAKTISKDIIFKQKKELQELIDKFNEDVEKMVTKKSIELEK